MFKVIEIAKSVEFKNVFINCCVDNSTARWGWTVIELQSDGPAVSLFHPSSKCNIPFYKFFF